MSFSFLMFFFFFFSFRSTTVYYNITSSSLAIASYPHNRKNQTVLYTQNAYRQFTFSFPSYLTYPRCIRNPYTTTIYILHYPPTKFPLRLPPSLFFSAAVHHTNASLTRARVLHSPTLRTQMCAAHNACAI